MVAHTGRMIEVHHLNNSRSHRILWLLEELGVPYTVVHHAREASLQAPPSLKAVHPLGKAPVIVDDGAAIAESGAIVEHLLEAHGGGRLAPEPGTPAHRRYRYWLHHAEGSAMPALTMKLIFSILPRRAPALIRPVARMLAGGMQAQRLDPQIADLAALWEAELGREGWFAGPEFSAADIQMGYPVEAAAERAGLTAPHPNIDRFVAAIRARPAYQRALAAGGNKSAIL